MLNNHQMHLAHLLVKSRSRKNRIEPQSVRNLFLVLFGILFAQLHIGSAETVLGSKELQRPNILVIMADDLGYGDLSSYGATDLETPNIDHLAESGMKWRRFYANCPVCSPTRAAFLTGKFPDQVGVPGVIRTHDADSWGYLDPNTPTLADQLKKSNYTTALIGKWHLGLTSPNRPNDRGFDLFKGWLGDMMDDYYTHQRHGINYMRENNSVIEPEGHATDLFTDWAVKFIRDQASARSHSDQPGDKPKPFFLFLAYNAPHTPIQPPKSELDRVKQSRPQLTDKRAKLVALIEHMDQGVGRVLGALKESGLYENTLVVFTSDNGGQIDVGANNGPLRDGKQSMYEGGLRVPCLVRWPGKIEPGSMTDAVGICSDLSWTLQRIATEKNIDQLHPLPPPEALDLLPFLMNPQTKPTERTLYFCRREGGLRYGGKTIEALIQGSWKLLQNSPFAPLELYHLEQDPEETQDLSSSHPQKVAELNLKLRKFIQEGGKTPWFHTEP